MWFRPRSVAVATRLLSALLVVSVAHAQPNARVDRVARAIARGDAHREAGDTISAVTFYREAIAVGPRRSDGYAALGALYLSLGEPARALEVYEAGTRAGVHGEALWLGYAETFEALGKPARALDTLRRWLALEPGSLAGLRALAEAAERRGAFVEALAARRALLDRLRTSPFAQDPAQQRLAATEAAQVRALELLLGGAERIRGRTLCDDPSSGEVARGLAHCP